MLVTPLASGSQGNSLLVEAGGVRLLIDAGLGANELEERLRAAGHDPRRIDALFVTHRHKDHVRGVTDFARRHRVRIWTTRRTARAIGTEVHARLRRIEFGRPFEVGELWLRALPLPHDAPETAGLLVQHGAVRFGYATDLGSVEPALVDGLARCDGLFVEFNHDAGLLADGQDPPHLKRRIASDTGHLSNAQAAELLRQLDHRGLRQVWLAHLSRRNNRPELAVAAARGALDSAVPVAVASQDEPGPTVDLHPNAVAVESCAS